MGASAPQVDGGMTEEQYKRLQMDDRKWQAELEDQKYERAQEAEQRRLDMEEANEQKLASVANAEELAIQQAEQTLSNEIDAQLEEDEDDNMGAIDFYGSLSQGQSTSDRPE